MATETDEHGRTWIVNEYGDQTCECGSNRFKHLTHASGGGSGARERCEECGRFA